MIKSGHEQTMQVAERTLITKELLEPFLKFPSGLSVKKAKQNAKTLGEVQKISQSEALKLICWGNGIINVIDFDQAFDELLLATFGRIHEELGFMKQNGQIVGCWWTSSEDSNYHATQSSPISDIEYNHVKQSVRYLNQLIEFITKEKAQKLKTDRFLLAVKDCIELLGDSFYRTLNDIPLSEVTDLEHISIDIEQLLFEGNGSSSTKLMSYALSSCYNSRGTAKILMKNSLENKYKHDQRSKFDISNKDDRTSLSEFASEYFQFGAMCYNLDKSNKDIIKRLLDNYQGW